jgi:hypothetical protein
LINTTWPASFRTALAAVAAAAGVLGAPAVAHAADSCVDSGTGVPLPMVAGPCADVLAQESRWLAAISNGDVAAVDAILGPTYHHIDASGELFDRARELASIGPSNVTFNASDQIVDIAGGTAVIHGTNTLMQGGKVKDQQRFTDVFVLQNGVWKALSAQETRI